MCHYFSDRRYETKRRLFKLSKIFIQYILKISFRSRYRAPNPKKYFYLSDVTPELEARIGRGVGRKTRKKRKTTKRQRA